MFPLIPMIGGAVSLVSGLLGNKSQSDANKQQQQYNTDMYERQKRDNLSFWNTQNAYNAPQEQMQRLRDAGLNANLVYGNGSATNTAGDISSPSVQSYTPRPVNTGEAISKGFNAYFDTQSRALQLDNMKAQNTVLAQEALLKASQKDATDANNPLKNGLMPYNLDYRKEGVRNLKLGGDNLFYEAAKKQSYSKYFDDNADLDNAIKKMELGQRGTSQKSVELQNKMRELELQLQQNGISKSDPIYFRVIGRLLSNFGVKL